MTVIELPVSRYSGWAEEEARGAAVAADAAPLAHHLAADPLDVAPSHGLSARAAEARRRLLRLLGREEGAATAEYAIATMAAVAFAGLLVVIMQSEEVRTILEDLVRQALTYEG